MIPFEKVTVNKRLYLFLNLRKQKNLSTIILLFSHKNKNNFKIAGTNCLHNKHCASKN